MQTRKTPYRRHPRSPRFYERCIRRACRRWCVVASFMILGIAAAVEHETWPLLRGLAVSGFLVLSIVPAAIRGGLNQPYADD